MDRQKIKCVAVIQCDVARERCSGAHCAISFVGRNGYFAGYGPEAVYYVPFQCGGCPGRRVSRLGHNLRKAMKSQGLEPDQIAVHLASCLVTDNGHYPPCPHLADIRLMLSRKGLRVVEGTRISDSADRQRQAGHYKPRPPLEP